MKKHARVVTGLFTIILLLSIWVYHIMEARSLTGSLAAEAAVLQAAFAQPEDGSPGFDVTLETVAARDIPLLGRIRGKSRSTHGRKTSGASMCTAPSSISTPTRPGTGA